MPRLQQKRGLFANIPTSGLLAGEIFFATDRGAIKMATDATTTINIVPAVDELVTLGSITGAADFIMMHDADGVGQKEKKITFDAFKTALNIPAGSTDELVAVVSGGTSGYLWGTDGTDGVVRMGATMTWAKDGGDGFVTVNVGDVDCGTF